MATSGDIRGQVRRSKGVARGSQLYTPPPTRDWEDIEDRAEHLSDVNGEIIHIQVTDRHIVMSVRCARDQAVKLVADVGVGHNVFFRMYEVPQLTSPDDAATLALLARIIDGDGVPNNHDNTAG